ncbi:SDR family NAD(P)-dependent oxidoreductase [Parvularcula marina]|uniref:SDR family NAD(P)-dependent oxidoreductase n=1 Tax=Parvularcula marina TaxID=2292771 RepID=A0A371RLC9_9PROT|nr:SDR family NAD(P)-dependent oxidoreductase [Parvularcula marina]RFB06270.1 SDR family NAD(P)-dependent oxidoreductase [Parvularcula marina]
MGAASDLIRFDSKVALITGAGAGIGASTALELGKRGARVIINDPASDGRAEAICEEIRHDGGKAVANTMPVGDFDTARLITGFAEETFGPVDILVNNAGISRPGPFWTRTDEEILDVLNVNLTAPYALMRAVWPGMAEKKSGRIVNLCSSAALGSGVSGAYAASKAGLVGLTKDAAIAAKPYGVLVNGVMPSARTALLDNHPDRNFRDWMEKHMPPAFIAKLICWLVSEQNTSTGSIYSAAGGYVSKIAFTESKGIFDAELEPEDLPHLLDRVSDFEDSTLINDQADHEKVVASFFPSPGIR